MSCFVDGREEVGVVTGEAATEEVGGGRDEWEGDAKGALSGERRNAVRVSGLNVRWGIRGA